MKLIMAISKDGYVARRKDDDMAWTGPFDKAVFRLLTCTDGGIIAAGSKTFATLPPLRGRQKIELSRRVDKPEALTLLACAGQHPNAWLIGGQEVAIHALQCAYVSEAHLCFSDRSAFPVADGGAVPERLTDFINDRVVRGTFAEWAKLGEVKVGDVRVEQWKRVLP